MSQIFNVYCDESCHLEKDLQKAMVLGAVWCPIDKIREISKRIKEIKEKHGLKREFEIKWTKVSPAKVSFYLDVIDYFFDNDDLHFRGLIADKSKLKHSAYDQTHDDWHYKIYFDMLKVVFKPDDQYRIYIDIKDTRSAEKLHQLHQILCNNMYDFDRKIIKDIQNVRSYEIEAMQLTDLLIGAISHFQRVNGTNKAKKEIIERIKERSGYSLEKSTLYGESKFNLFFWSGE